MKRILSLSIAATFGVLAGCSTPTSIGSTTWSTNSSKQRMEPEAVAQETHQWRLLFNEPRLQQLVDAAIAENADLKIAIQRVEASKAQLSAARGVLAPTVSGVGGASLRRFGEFTMDGAGNKGVLVHRGRDLPVNLPDYSVGLQAQWEVDLWGKLRNQKAAAQGRALASEAYRKLVLVNLVTDVASLYLQLATSDAILAVIDQYLLNQRDALQALRAQFDAGGANLLAVQEVEAQLHAISSLRLDSESERLVIEGSLRMLLGRSDVPIPKVFPALLELPVPNQSVGDIQSTLLKRPDVIQAEQELMATKADLEAARAMFLPSVTVGALLGLQAFRPDLVPAGGSGMYSIAGNLVAPIVNRSGIRAAFQQAGAAQIEALVRYQQAIVDAYVEIQNHQAQATLLRELDELKAREVSLRSASVSIAGDLFKSQRISYLEGINVRQGSLESQLDLLDIRKRRLLQQVAFYRAKGGG
jgi:outer membrane protein, multidrug efflux system